MVYRQRNPHTEVIKWAWCVGLACGNYQVEPRSPGAYGYMRRVNALHAAELCVERLRLTDVEWHVEKE